MRILSTTFLILLTAILGAWFVNDFYEKNWGDFLETQESLKDGSLLYPDSKKVTYQYLSITDPTGKELKFQKNIFGIWECISPYLDRADLFHIQALIEFTGKAEVVDSIPLTKIEPKDYGFNSDAYRVAFITKDDKTALSYRIGIPSQWQKRIITQDKQMQQTITDFPTIFVIKENTPDDKILYLVKDPKSGIRDQFRNNFEEFRDHRPFALNIHFLEKVSIKRADSEIVIDRSTQASPWRISKPLDLATDTKAFKKLLTGLSQLSAVKIHQSQDVTLPQDISNITEVSIKNLGDDKETTLTIYPVEEDATTAYAKVDDRPDIVFELPLETIIQENATQPNSKVIQTASLSILPKTINEIRARNMLTLTKKNKSNIRGFIIKHSQKAPIIIARKRPGTAYELLAATGVKQRINDINLSNLIATLSVYPVKDFVSDAAGDLSIYNFQNPILSVDIRPFSGRTQRIVFSQKDGIIYATKLIKTVNKDWMSSSVVWEIDPKAYLLITKNEYEWKDNTLWNLTVNDITSFRLEYPSSPHSPTLTVNYDYMGDAFKGVYVAEGTPPKNVTERIDPIQAKYFLNNTHYISAQRRLGPNNATAKKALETPILRATILTTKYDDEGLPTTDTIISTITFAKPTPNATHPIFYYAKTNRDEDYLIVPRHLFHKFTINLFGDE